MLGHCFGDVDFVVGVVRVDFVGVCKIVGTRNQEFLINHKGPYLLVGS